MQINLKGFNLCLQNRSMKSFVDDSKKQSFLIVKLQNKTKGYSKTEVRVVHFEEYFCGLSLFRRPPDAICLTFP